MRDKLLERLNGILGFATKSERNILLCALGAALLLALLLAGLGLSKDGREAEAAQSEADGLLKAYSEAQASLLALSGGNGLDRTTVLPLESVSAIGTLSISAREALVVAQKAATAKAAGYAYMANGLYPWDNGCLLMGGDYPAVFGGLDELRVGESILFTDITGKTYSFSVCAPEEREGYALALSDGRSIVYAK